MQVSVAWAKGHFPLIGTWGRFYDTIISVAVVVFCVNHARVRVRVGVRVRVRVRVRVWVGFE